MKFDPKRPHGEVWGSTDASRYTQDGKFFDGEGNEIVTPPPLEITASGKMVDPKQYAKDVADAAAILAAKK